MTNITMPPVVLTAAFAGIGFVVGACLQRAGLASSRTLSGLFRFKDATAAKVLLSALATALIALSILGGLGFLPPSDIVLYPTLLGGVALAGILAGAGFALGGWTPSTAAAGLGSGRMDALLYLAGAFGGVWLYDFIAPYLGGLLTYRDLGTNFLYNHVDLDWRLLGFAIVVSAVACFWLAELFSPKERRYMKGRFLTGYSILLVALGALLLAFPSVPAPFNGGRATFALDNATSRNMTTATAASADQADFIPVLVAPAQAADRLMAGGSGLLAIDLRPDKQYADFHIKGAQNVPLEQLLSTLANTPGVTYLLYAADTDTAQRAAKVLHGQGITNTAILDGGLAAFYESCLTPISLRSQPPSPEIALRVPAWREYFLGDAPARPANLPAQLALRQTGMPSPAPAVASGPSTPALPGFLQPQWLAKNLDKTTVIDLRDLNDYMQAHIPGAFSLDVMNLQTTVNGIPGQLLPVADLARRFGQMGMTANSSVAVIAERLPDAARLASALESTGNANYGILSGGFPAWLAHGYSAGNTLPVAKSTDYQPGQALPGLFVDKAWMMNNQDDSNSTTVLIDTRSTARFNGTDANGPRFGPRDGHIPGAVNRSAQDDLTDQGKFKPLDELRAVYQRIIPASDTPVVVYCLTGRLASQTWFLLNHLLGYTNVRIYDGGWAEWSSDMELPIEM